MNSSTSDDPSFVHTLPPPTATRSAATEEDDARRVYPNNNNARRHRHHAVDDDDDDHTSLLSRRSWRAARYSASSVATWRRWLIGLVLIVSVAPWSSIYVFVAFWWQRGVVQNAVVSPPSSHVPGTWRPLVSARWMIFTQEWLSQQPPPPSRPHGTPQGAVPETHSRIKAWRTMAADPRPSSSSSSKIHPAEDHEGQNTDLDNHSSAQKRIHNMASLVGWHEMMQWLWQLPSERATADITTGSSENPIIPTMTRGKGPKSSPLKPDQGSSSSSSTLTTSGPDEQKSAPDSHQGKHQIFWQILTLLSGQQGIQPFWWGHHDMPSKSTPLPSTATTLTADQLVEFFWLHVAHRPLPTTYPSVPAADPQPIWLGELSPEMQEHLKAALPWIVYVSLGLFIHTLLWVNHFLRRRYVQGLYLAQQEFAEYDPNRAGELEDEEDLHDLFWILLFLMGFPRSWIRRRKIFSGHRAKYVVQTLEPFTMVLKARDRMHPIHAMEQQQHDEGNTFLTQCHFTVDNLDTDEFFEPQQSFTIRMQEAFKIPLAGESGEMESKGRMYRPVLEPCAICLQSFALKEKITWSKNPKCRHYFHRECILPWLVRKCNDDHRCPCCRQGFLWA